MKSPENMESKFDQQKHPELREGEMCLTNSGTYGFNLDYKSKRIGNIAYDEDGNKVEGLVPVFVSKEEYERRKKERE